MSESKSIGSLEELEELFNQYNEKLIVLDFYSDLCAPCRRAEQKIESLKKMTCSHTLFVLIKVKNKPDIIKILEKFQVYTIPKFVIIRDGKQIFITNDPDELEKELKKLISKKHYSNFNKDQKILRRS